MEEVENLSFSPQKKLSGRESGDAILILSLSSRLLRLQEAS